MKSLIYWPSYISQSLRPHCHPTVGWTTTCILQVRKTRLKKVICWRKGSFPWQIPATHLFASVALALLDLWQHMMCFPWELTFCFVWGRFYLALGKGNLNWLLLRTDTSTSLTANVKKNMSHGARCLSSCDHICTYYGSCTVSEPSETTLLCSPVVWELCLNVGIIKRST